MLEGLLTLERFKSNEDASIGRLLLNMPYRNTEFLCHTLEDEHRDKKVKHETRIPAGRYPLVIRRYGGFHQKYSKIFPSFHEGMIQIDKVPNFTDILMHIGNTDQDTSGCPLMGVWQGADNFIGTSKATYIRVYRRLLPLIKNGVLKSIEIKNEDL